MARLAKQVQSDLELMCDLIAEVHRLALDAPGRTTPTHVELLASISACHASALRLIAEQARNSSRSTP